MIATEPLPAAFWEQAGLADRETFNDARHLIVYGQRTADDRLAFGGRGAPYHYGSRIGDRFDRDDGGRTAALGAALQRAVPVPRRRAHRSPLGRTARRAPRLVRVGRVRPPHGLAWAGGYVGDGVAASNLAGRTLAALITGAGDDLTTLPWVQHRSPKWEPEPLRWLGVRAARRCRPRSTVPKPATTGPRLCGPGWPAALLGHWSTLPGYRCTAGSCCDARRRTVYTPSPDSTPPRANSRPSCQLDRPSSGRPSAYWPSTQRVKPSPTNGALTAA